MTARDFCYWLQGLLEIGGIQSLTKEQVKIIQNHLNLVFQHEIDKTIPGNPEQLQDIHDAFLTPIYRC